MSDRMIEVDIRDVLINLIENQPTCPEVVIFEFLQDLCGIKASAFEAAMLDLQGRGLIVRNGGQTGARVQSYPKAAAVASDVEGSLN